MEIAEMKIFDTTDTLIVWDTITEKSGGCRANNGASKAFDGRTDTDFYNTGRWKAQSICVAADNCAALLVTKNDGVKVGKYEFVVGTVSSRNPTRWKLEARNSETDSWTLLHEAAYDGTFTSLATMGPYVVDVPTSDPTMTPSFHPSFTPTSTPTLTPSAHPTMTPTVNPSPMPSAQEFMMKIKGFHGNPVSSLADIVFEQVRTEVKNIVQAVKSIKESTNSQNKD